MLLYALRVHTLIDHPWRKAFGTPSHIIRALLPHTHARAQEEDKGKVKRALQALKLEGVSEVVGLQELRTDYKEFQERRKLRDGAWSVGWGVGGGGMSVCSMYAIGIWWVCLHVCDKTGEFLSFDGRCFWGEMDRASVCHVWIDG